MKRLSAEAIDEWRAILDESRAEALAVPPGAAAEPGQADAFLAPAQLGTVVAADTAVATVFRLPKTPLS